MRVIALGRDAGAAVGAAVAEVALAALDLLGVPELVEEAVVDLGVVRLRDGVGEVGGRAGLLRGARAGAAVLEIDGELIDVLAGAVAGAAVGAGGHGGAHESSDGEGANHLEGNL